MTSTLPVPRRPLALAIALALAASGAQAAIIIVKDGGDAGTPNSCTLRQAIESANNDDPGASSCVTGSGNDTIMFDPSLVDTTVTLSLGQLEIKQPVTIDSTGQTRTIDAGGASRVLYVNTAKLVANSLTLTGGTAPAGGFGGGILSNAGTIELTNTTISGNLATSGGGIHATGGTVTLSNCTISGNGSTLDGGGLFAGNTATVTFGNSMITGNTAGMHGGGVYGSFFTVTFTNTTISGNAAQKGAGVWSFTGNASFTDSDVSGNTIGLNFGGVYSAFGTLTLTNTTISGNTVTDVGGGVYLSHGMATLTNSTIAGNAAPMSGGFGTQSGTVTLANTILANNTGGDCSSAGNDTISAAYNLVADAASASACGIGVGGANGNIVGQDPMLGALGDYGGPTKTMPLDATSPALNAGSVQLAFLGNDTLNYDQRGFGFPRTLDHMVDIGAYQHQGDRFFADGNEPEP